MNSTEYVFFSDPGHAWLEVTKIEAMRLKVPVSDYSYKKGQGINCMLYLEEDCDAPAFLDAKKAAGEPFTIREQYQENTPIRNYSHA